MNRVPKIVWSLLACVICIVITAGACLILADKGASSDKYLEVIRVIETTFYQPKDTTSLEDASASAMVASLGDPSSYYLPASEYEDYKLTLTNQYIGIGITTQYNDNYGYLTVLSVTPGSPADQAHVKVGNMIASVDDIDVSTYTPEQLDELLRSYDDKENESEKYFTLHLLNTQGGKADAKMKCELIYAEPVVYYILDDNSNKENRSATVGYLRIRNFDDSAAASVKSAVESLQASLSTCVTTTAANRRKWRTRWTTSFRRAISSSSATATVKRRRTPPAAHISICRWSFLSTRTRPAPPRCLPASCSRRV